MSFLQLVLSLDKTIKEIILLWRICQFDRYRNNPMDMDEKFLNIKALAKYKVAAQRESSPHKEESVSVTGIFRP